MCGRLHSAPAVLAGSGAAVFALGGVESVADREHDALGVHEVCLDESMAAEIGENVHHGRAQEVFAGEAQDEGPVLQQGLLDGGRHVGVDVLDQERLRIALGLDHAAEFELPAAIGGEGIEQLREADGPPVELRHADAGGFAGVGRVDAEPLGLKAQCVVQRPAPDGGREVHERAHRAVRRVDVARPYENDSLIVPGGGPGDYCVIGACVVEHQGDELPDGGDSDVVGEFGL